MREEWCSLGKSSKRGVEENNEKEVGVTWQRVRSGRMGNTGNISVFEQDQGDPAADVHVC